MIHIFKNMKRKIKDFGISHTSVNEFYKFILETIIAIVGCWIAFTQTKIYAQQEEIARKQTLPEIALDISYDGEDYLIEFSSIQGIVYNAKADIYSCVLATVYDFSDVEFENEEDEINFNPNEMMFNGSEFTERTIVLPIRSSGTYSGQLIGNSTKRKDSLMEFTIYRQSMQSISECANFDIPADDTNKHWVCFSEPGIFIKLNYQDIYGEKHNDYYLLNPKLKYEGLYKLNDKMGEFVYNDCYSVMGNISAVDCIPVGDIDLDIGSITDEIAKREIQLRYKKYLKISKEDIIPVFYTYISD